jgi:hypothetical protein
MQRVSSLVTLGTPHETSTNAWVDQTRGLIRAIETTPTCCPEYLTHERKMEITCICSGGLVGQAFTTNIESFIAATSYFPQVGKVDASLAGDGIVPLELAFLPPPARKVVLDQCSLTQLPIRHSHVVPTPWNLWDGYAPSIILPDETYPSYVSKGVLPQWARFMR